MMNYSFLKALRSYLKSFLETDRGDDIAKMRLAIEQTAIMAKEEFVARSLSDPRYVDPLRLERCGSKTYSQYDEDGIIDEIFRRIGTTNKRFIELGVEAGLENNTLKLLLENWSGLWVEGNSTYAAAIRTRFKDVLENGRLSLAHAFVTTENINEILAPWGNGEIDLLSIDIDGNDFYVWKALKIVQPRVVVIEYNAKLRPPISIVQEYQSKHVWSGTDYFGASLEALTRLGKELGYSLVATNFAGVNAFFVRSDLTADRFQEPFSSANHYNPARYFLLHLYVSGHPPDWGRYISY
jgi:hypothetical protein